MLFALFLQQTKSLSIPKIPQSDDQHSHQHQQQQQLQQKLEQEETLFRNNQDWLMKSLDQLLYEMKEFGHEYNVQVQSRQASDEKNQKSLAHDLAILRADHTIMAEQQRNLIQLIQKVITKIDRQADLKQKQMKHMSNENSLFEGKKSEQHEQQATDDWMNELTSSAQEKSYSHRRLRKLHRQIRHNSPKLTFHLHKLCRMTNEEEDDDDNYE